MVSTTVLFATAWIAVMNPKGIMNLNHYFPFGDQCVLEFPLQADRLTAVDRQALYRYAATESADPLIAHLNMGTACPPGTLFLMGEAEYEQRHVQSTAEQQQWRQQRQQNEKALEELPALRERIEKALEELPAN